MFADSDLNSPQCRQQTRERLDEWGDQMLTWARSRHELRELIRGKYTTRNRSTAACWVALYSSPVGDDFDLQAALGHIHLVVPTSGKDAWIGVNVEFKSPRKVALDRLRLCEHEVLNALNRAYGCKLTLLSKRVLNRSHRNYEWLYQPFDAAHPAQSARDVNAADLEWLAGQLEQTKPWGEEHHIEPILLLYRTIPADVFVAPQCREFSQETILNLAPFLGLLTHDLPPLRT